MSANRIESLLIADVCVQNIIKISVFEKSVVKQFEKREPNSTYKNENLISQIYFFT